MKAEEALKRTKENLCTNVPQKQYDGIMQRIEDYVSCGEFEIWEDRLKEKLKNEGYKVKWSFPTGGYNISWK
jgi:regulator of sigma D